MTTAVILLATLMAVQEPEADRPAAPPDDREVEVLVESVRRRFDDPKIEAADRARLTLDAAEALDEAARLEPTAARRADRWRRAVDLLDSFLEANPGNPLGAAVALEAAIARWSEGRTWSALVDRSPDDAAARTAAVEALDDAVVRLRQLWSMTREVGTGDPLAQAVRYHFALSLADRADLEDDPGRALDARQQALGRLRVEPTDPELAGRAELLKARVLIALDELEDADEALKDAAEKPGPTEAERLDVRLALRLARRQFEEALAEVEASGLDQAEKDLRAVRVRARQWINLFPGEKRAAAEADAFDRVRRLREEGAPQASAALAALAATLIEPDAQDDPGRWELLAEGHYARGDYRRAAALNAGGADRAEALGDPERAWLMRYRSAAIRYRAGDLDAAATALGPVADAARDPKGPAPADQRTDASLLQALVLGRLAAGGDPRARSAYEAALKAHVAAFPDDPTAGEARWTLGRLAAADGRAEEARESWSSVPPDHPRWIDAHLAILDEQAGVIHAEIESGATDDARSRLQAAETDVAAFLDEAPGPEARNAIELAGAELDLTPGLGDPAAAREALDRLLRSVVDADRRDRVRRLRILAMAATGDTADADREARQELERSAPVDLVDLAARIDRVATAMPTGPDRRQVAAVVRTIAERLLARPDTLDPILTARARVLRIRGQLDAGDLDGARASAEQWRAELDPSALPPDLVGPLADVLERLGLYAGAADAYRVLVRRRPPGTLPWFEARYGLAVAYYRTDRAAEARRLIDGTIALHPELGGGELKEKFLRLRRRLGDR